MGGQKHSERVQTCTSRLVWREVEGGGGGAGAEGMRDGGGVQGSGKFPTLPREASWPTDHSSGTAWL